MFDSSAMAYGTTTTEEAATTAVPNGRCSIFSLDLTSLQA